MVNALVPSEQGLSSQHIITVRQFLELDYEGKVERGECRVFWIDTDQPSPNDPQYAAWKHMMQEFGNAEPVYSVEQASSDYFYIYTDLDTNSCMGSTGDTQLVVFAGA